MKAVGVIEDDDRVNEYKSRQGRGQTQNAQR